MAEKHMDSFKSFKMVEAMIERDFRAGKLSRERANRVLRGARENYRNQSYNRKIDIINKKNA